MNADAEDRQKDMNLKNYLKIKLLISGRVFPPLHRLSTYD
jgi:hypothetical protein